MNYRGVSDTISERAAAAIKRLRAAAHYDAPLSAVELAVALGVPGDPNNARDRETMKRRVREAVKYARENPELGARICADGEGYWLARSAQEWADYKAACKANARFRFVAIARAQRAVTDAMNGQQALFETPRDVAARMAWAQ